MTFGEACLRFANLVTARSTIEDSIREAIERIYEMGRWPGTTVELPLDASSFELDSATNEWFILFDDDIYDGAIGFRIGHKGYGIMDQTVLYKEEAGGDRCFIDCGVVDDLQTNVTITGDLTDGVDPVVFPTLLPVGDGWTDSGNELTGIGVAYALLPDGGNFTLQKYNDGVVLASWTGTGGATPDLCTFTTDGSATGTPVAALSSSTRFRKYRVPYNYDVNADEQYVLLKKEPPSLTSDDDILPIHSTGALKQAILAVQYEISGDENRAEAKWSKFYTFMEAATKQTEGPKRYYIGLDMCLRRKPSQRN